MHKRVTCIIMSRHNIIYYIMRALIIRLIIVKVLKKNSKNHFDL